jgi:hypothetical protein
MRADHYRADTAESDPLAGRQDAELGRSGRGSGFEHWSLLTSRRYRAVAALASTWQVPPPQDTT